MKAQGTFHWIVVFLALTVFSAAGCEKKSTGPVSSNNAISPAPTLVSTQVVAQGVECPNGGISISSGVDWNMDGALNPEEVVATEVVCNATNGPLGESMMVVTDLPVGDASCQEGGQRMDSGVDANGDRVLDSGEISSTAYFCNPPPVATAPPSAKPMDAPTAPAAQYVIDTTGGNGGALNGGSGGSVSIESDGSDGGHVKVFNTGVAQTNWVFPDKGVTDLGPVPLTVSSGMMTLDNNSSVGIGSYYHSGNYIYYRHPTKGTISVTGIYVAPGATLVLASWEGNNSVLRLEKDLINFGTITVPMRADGISRNNLALIVQSFFGGTGSNINLTGSDSTIQGGFGGDFYLSAVASIINKGAINTSGGSGTAGNGGAGGIITLSSDVIYNSGLWTANGGNAMGGSGNGGGGGAINLFARYLHAMNSANLSAKGGHGTGSGGPGGSIDLQVDGSGTVLNSGDLTSSGGNGNSGNGGSGGFINISSLGGSVRSSGNMDTQGGSSVDARGSSGGPVTVNSYSGYYGSFNPIDSGRAGDVHLSGNLVTRGGSGGGGSGDGGNITISLFPDWAYSQQEVILFGYSSITVNGGEGGINGGGGGVVNLMNGSTNYPISAGAVINQVPISANGGNGLSNVGGNGGRIFMSAYSNLPNPQPHEILLQTANITANGGTGGAAGGGGGGIQFTGQYGVNNSGNITLMSGNGVTAGGNSYGNTSISSLGSVENSGVMNLSGGDASGVGGLGGLGGILDVYAGRAITNSGNIDLSGGNAASGIGGMGGTLTLFSGQGQTTNTGIINLLGGTGTLGNGGAGTQFIDGF